MSKTDEWKAAKKMVKQLTDATLRIEVARSGQVPSIKVEIMRNRSAWVEGGPLMLMLSEVLGRHEKAIINDLIGEAGMLVRRLQEKAGQEARETLVELHGVEDVQPDAGEEGGES